MLIGTIIITGIIFIKYKPLYKVVINDEVVGYVLDKNNFDNRINEYINTKEEECIAFKTLEAQKEYSLELVAKNKVSNENEIFEKIVDNTEIIYTTFAILVEDDITSYVETETKAQEVVNQLNEKYAGQNISIGMRQIYSSSKPELVESDIAIATISTDRIAPIVTSRAQAARAKTSTQSITKKSNANGVVFSVKPVNGRISSKFGASGAKRSSRHTGLDIATSQGTPIKAASAGTVTFAQYSGSYGNLIKISHGSGVETWYAHCSELYAYVGQQITAGEVIAAVGSTGNSTGPHLHLEIRINGAPVNPQIYMY